MFSNLYTLYCRKFAAATNFIRFVVNVALISLMLLLAQITPLADLSRVSLDLFSIHVIITLHSSIAATSASQYKKKN